RIGDCDMAAGPFSATRVLPGYGTGGACPRRPGLLAAEPLPGRRPGDEERHERDERERRAKPCRSHGRPIRPHDIESRSRMRTATGGSPGRGAPPWGLIMRSHGAPVQPGRQTEDLAG